MSSRVIDDFTAAWQPDGSGLWTASASPSAARWDGTGMLLTAGEGPGSPFVRRTFAPALDLRDVTELRLWLRSSRAAAGPFYLAFDAGTDAWQRNLRVDQANVWQLHRLWLGDMPEALRQSVATLRIRSLAPVSFTAAVDELQAGTPQGIRDVETALRARIDNRFEGAPALYDVPSDQAQPYITIVPFAVRALPDNEGADVTDNETAGGASVRPYPRRLRLDYRIEVSAAQRAQRAAIIEGIVAEFARESQLVVFGEPQKLLPFEPDPLLAGPVASGVTPLYYRTHTWLETGPRVQHTYAVPFLVTGQPDGVPREVSPV